MTCASHQDRVAVVTGAASGIGRAIAVRLAQAGCHLAIADLQPAGDVTGEIEALGRTAYAEICDLADPAAIERFCVSVLERFGRCDILVNCAASQLLRDLVEVDLATWRQVQAVNVDAAFLLCRAFIPGMAERGFGRIVNVASNTVWQTPRGGFVPYVTSKAALVGLTRALAVEVGEHGITVNALAPGLTATATAQGGNAPETYESVRLQQSIKQTLRPTDQAGVVVFLTSDDAALISGQAFRVDAGLVTL